VNTQVREGSVQREVLIQREEVTVQVGDPGGLQLKNHRPEFHSTLDIFPL
jgi:hypothetical protein